MNHKQGSVDLSINSSPVMLRFWYFKFRYETLRVHAFRYDQARLATIGKFHVTRSVTIEYDRIRLNMISRSRAPDLVRSNTCRCVLVRSDALLHVDNDLMRSVAIGCEFGLNVCPDHDKGNYDLATIGLDRHIDSQFDY